MYIHGAGIFTYKTGLFLGQMLVNIPYVEHMGYNLYDHIYYIYNIYTIRACQFSLVSGQKKQRATHASKGQLPSKQQNSTI